VGCRDIVGSENYKIIDYDQNLSKNWVLKFVLSELSFCPVDMQMKN